MMDQTWRFSHTHSLTKNWPKWLILPLEYFLQHATVIFLFISFYFFFFNLDTYIFHFNCNSGGKIVGGRISHFGPLTTGRLWNGQQLARFYVLDHPDWHPTLLCLMGCNQDFLDKWGMGMNGELEITFLPIHPWSDEWGWMDRPRILFIPIHLSPCIPINTIKWLLLNFYYLGKQSRNYVRMYLNWVMNTFQVFFRWTKNFNFLIALDKWGRMACLRILFSPIHPHSSDQGWMGKKVIPIHPHSPLIQEALLSPICPQERHTFTILISFIKSRPMLIDSCDRLGRFLTSRARRSFNASTTLNLP